MQSAFVERGRSYFKNGSVRKHRLADDECTHEFVVVGTENYDVSVELSRDGKAIEETECTCPSFEENGECKHIAAALFYLREKSDKTAAAPSKKDKSSDKQAQKDELRSVLQAASAEELREFLAQEMRESAKLRELFLVHFARYRPYTAENATKEQDALKKEIQKVIKKHALEHYEDERILLWNDSVNDALESGIIKDAQGYARRPNGMAKAIEIAQVLWQAIDELWSTARNPPYGYSDEYYDCDDFGGELLDIVVALFEFIANQPLQNADYERFFSLLLRLAATKEADVRYCADEEVDNDNDRTRDWLRLLGKMVRAEERDFQRLEQTLLWITQHRGDKFDSSIREVRLQMLLKKGNTAAALTLLRANFEDNTLRELLVNYLLDERKDPAQAASLLREIIAHDEQKGRTSDKWLTLLQRAAALSGDSETQLEMLRRQFASNPSEKLLQQMRALCPSENDWKNNTQATEACVLQRSWKTTKETALETLYAHTGQVEKLWQMAKNAEDRKILKRHDTLLAPHYKNEIAKIYEGQIRYLLPQNYHKSNYEEMLDCLRRLRKIGFETLAKDIATHIRKTYPTRKAFIEQITKAGL